MAKTSRFNVSYDAEADVLYVTARIDVAARGVEDARGIVWRFDGKGDVISATVMDFMDVWSGQTDDLASEMARHFHLPNTHAENLIQHIRNEVGG